MTEPTTGSSKRSSESYAAALKTATSADEDAGKRVAAFAGVARAICDDKEKLEDVIKVLKDTQSPQAVRLAALRALQSASFSVVKFNHCRPEYLAALRSLIDDPDPELRQRVLGILAREQDGYTQQRLLEGLQQPEKALVPPEKALTTAELRYPRRCLSGCAGNCEQTAQPRGKTGGITSAGRRSRVGSHVRGDPARQERATGNTPAFGIGTPFPGAEKNASVRARHCP